MHISRQMFSDLENYWWQLQKSNKSGAVDAGWGDLSVPQRSSFNPMDIPGLLPNIYLAELKSRYELHVRLSGTVLDRELPLDSSSRNAFDNYDKDQWEFYADMHANICRQPCGAYYSREVTMSNGESFMMARNSLPLADEQGVNRYIVGVICAVTEEMMPFQKDIAFTHSSRKEFHYIDLGFGVPVINEI